MADCACAACAMRARVWPAEGKGSPLRLDYGIWSIQGRRKTQEDAHSAVPKMLYLSLSLCVCVRVRVRACVRACVCGADRTHAYSTYSEGEEEEEAQRPFAFFGVYDGHGGEKVTAPPVARRPFARCCSPRPCPSLSLSTNNLIPALINLPSGGVAAHAGHLDGKRGASRLPLDRREEGPRPRL